MLCIYVWCVSTAKILFFLRSTIGQTYVLYIICSFGTKILFFSFDVTRLNSAEVHSYIFIIFLCSEANRGKNELPDRVESRIDNLLTNRGEMNFGGYERDDVT